MKIENRSRNKLTKIIKQRTEKAQRKHKNTHNYKNRQSNNHAHTEHLHKLSLTYLYINMHKTTNTPILCT